MRRLDAALVAITLVLATVWYVLRVAPAEEESASVIASPMPPSGVAPISSAPALEAGGAIRSTSETGPAEAIEVVHKHTLGSCRGRLSATAVGLRYEPTRAGDGFDVARASVERIEADSRRKVLAVKLRGGRTYNFTAASGQAEPLLAFQKAFAKPRPRAGAAP